MEGEKDVGLSHSKPLLSVRTSAKRQVLATLVVCEGVSPGQDPRTVEFGHKPEVEVDHKCQVPCKIEIARSYVSL